jgi:AmmeMemoRadiSam system protein B
MWFPQDKKELEKKLDEFLDYKTKFPNKVHGIIVPHAGYEFSGKIAGKAFSFMKNKKIENVIIVGPSHYTPLKGVITSDKKYFETPLGKIKLFNKDFKGGDIEIEHSIKNHVPFLQKLGIKEVMPLMVGEITNEEAKKIAEKISKIPAFYVFSTDLSHFFPYEKAIEKDKETIRLIENLDLENFPKIDACGFFPLLILFYLCKIKNWKPKLIEYQNSGDVTKEKSSVVGYASFWI